MNTINKIFLLLGMLSVGCSTTEKQRVNPATGSVSTASPEASQAGFKILQNGGNAIDAAVAVSFVLGVTEPAMSGLGGGTQVLLAPPGQKPIAINGATISPAATPTGASKDDLTYHRRTTIPSTVKVMHYLWSKYGSGKVSWHDLLAPAIQLAEEGFAVGHFRHQVFKKYEKSLRKSPHLNGLFDMPQQVGGLFQQPLLAATLRQLANNGAEDFYRGAIAKKIAADMEQHNGWITLADLEAFPDPQELEALHTNYRGWDIYTQPPPCGGWTALLALNILEQHPASELQAATQSRFEKVLQALHLAHRDRKQSPVTNLQQYHPIIRQKLSKTHAGDLLLQANKGGVITNAVEKQGGETTHFSVVDQQGTAIAVTASINAYFGAKAAAPGLGFLYNSYMDDFELDQPGHPFAIRPNAMNYSSMSPTIVQKNDTTHLVIGSPGSARIISTVAQLTQLWIDGKMGIKAVVSQPRLHSINGRIYFEDQNIPPSWLTPFREKDFTIRTPSRDLLKDKLNPYFGGVHAIAWENGQWVGASDPRRDGLALP